jgi:hypothetical protein
MALRGSIEIEGLDITGSYTNVSSFSYNNINGSYHINYVYNTYINQEHRESNRDSFLSGRSSFLITGSLDLFSQIYDDLKKQNYLNSSSLENC